MNAQMAYLLGMILGNGEVQRGSGETTVTIDIPHKNLQDDEGRDVETYVRASLIDIKGLVEPLLESTLTVTSLRRSTAVSFTKGNQDYAIREILRFIGNGARHSTMTMSRDLFAIAADEKRELLRGMADVTGYIRRSNIAFGEEGAHRVYLEIPGNWQMVIDVANLMKDLDVPVQTIDFGHPNFRDSHARKYNAGKTTFWKKEHQVKVWANEFLPIGFNIGHKRMALQKYADELLAHTNAERTHKFYWEGRVRRRVKPPHPAENDASLPAAIRGRHFDSWADLAAALGYHG